MHIDNKQPVSAENKKIERELIITSDGSHTLYIPAMDEQYHSVNGAIGESQHIFIEKGLKHINKQELRIFEIGFGTGLNAFLTWLESRKENQTITYFTVEKYPLEKEIYQHLNYPELLSPNDRDRFLQLHTASWEQESLIGDHFILHKMQADINTSEIPDKLDLVYFDAFAPDKQAGIWKQELFDKLYQRMSTGAVLTTYCAKGVIRRMMQASGFQVERLEGPPGKREILRATKEG